MADRVYGINFSSNQVEQGQTYTNGFPVVTLSSHLNLLEDFDPINRPGDPFRWIPQGIYYDMTDDRNDLLATPLRVVIDDQVNAYTNQQLFQALGPNVKSMPQYRARVLSENNNNQATQVNLLFNGYNY